MESGWISISSAVGRYYVTDTPRRERINFNQRATPSVAFSSDLPPDRSVTRNAGPFLSEPAIAPGERCERDLRNLLLLLCLRPSATITYYRLSLYNRLAAAAVSGTAALFASRPIRAFRHSFGRPRQCTNDVNNDDDDDGKTTITMVKTGKGGGPHPAASGRVVLARKPTQTDAVARELRRVREENARRQEHDYSHVFRKKSLLDFVRLSFVIMGIEIVYSAETAFVTPILLGIGIEHQLMTVVWGISPLIGFIVSPFLGTFSDRCRSRFGRRRPVLVMLGIGLVLGECQC
ncbi:hypothetical protein ZHAS_00022185 [Anopheles sinensis]|uniref:Uncharacterized protein n=1 Tax=Anopheles sinensis TaxID=74873 RepID=A0A084WUP5_ANOSI|nr:hypothetical protein ZHAS_00022185 [Anopheles sinensis]